MVIVNSNEIRKGIATEGWFTVFNGNENLGRTETSNVFFIVMIIIMSIYKCLAGLSADGKGWHCD